MRRGATGITCACRIAGALVVLCAAFASAQERITLNMRNADLGSVLQWLAETSGKRVVVDPRVRGQITILARDPMTQQEAYEVVITALNVYGYTAIEQGDVLQVVPAANIKTDATAIIDSLQEPGGPDLPVNEVVQLSTLPAEQVATVLRPLMPTYAGLVALPGGNSLLVTDTLKGVRRIVRLARELDRNATLELDVVPLGHASAVELIDALKQLLGKDSTALQMVADERVNAIVMAGTPELRARTRDLIRRLDQPETEDSSVQVIYLHYLKAEEMVGVLRGMLDSGGKKEGAAPQSPVAIESSTSTNALVVSAPRDQMAQIQDVVRRLDIRRAQVLVEAIIAEVGDSTMQQLGVEWRTAFNGDGTEAIQRFSNGQVNADGGRTPLRDLGRGLTVGYFQNGTLRALLHALQVDGDTDIVSTPSIVTLDNQEAEILVGSNVPFKTGEAPTTTTGTGAQPSTSTFTTIERQDIGVSLKVKPRINQGDSITLDIEQEVETLTDSTDAEDVITDKRSIHTSVMLQDEDVLVLGGLSQNQHTKTVEKIPVLGSLPVLGALFRTTTDTVTRRNLMVFVRTRILTDLEVAEKETRERYNQIRETQQGSSAPPPIIPKLQSPVLPPLEEKATP